MDTDAASVSSLQPAAPYQLFFYNVSSTGNKECPQFSYQSTPGGLLASFVKAIMHFEAIKADVVTAVYAPETAYIYFYADEVDWVEKLPPLLGPMPTLEVKKEEEQ
ncbi:hypothetical protein H0H92_006581 [Tricholoma furcatifolium]|nr:hypothetical protein H0H92_006581 [Tricholoma furcatifolium]